MNPQPGDIITIKADGTRIPMKLDKACVKVIQTTPQITVQVPQIQSTMTILATDIIEIIGHDN